MNKIRLRGVRQNNLKGFNLELPPGKLIVITGLSGAGKSSLLFEVLHAEGQRRYVETFSPYVRQFLEILPRPKVDEIENVRPSIAVEQRHAVRASRSTIGTMTDLCDYFKVWFLSVAKLVDPASGKYLREENASSIAKGILKEFAGQNIVIGFRSRRPETFPAEDFLHALSKAGHVRASEGKGFHRIEKLEKQGWRSEELLVALDRIALRPTNRNRLHESVVTALEAGRGEVLLLDDNGELIGSRYEGLRSPVNGTRFSSASPATFSFNSPVGACPRCRGFGRIIEVDYRRVIPDETLSIAAAAIRAFHGKVYGHSQRDLLRAARRCEFPIDKPWRFLSDAEKKFIFEGEDDYRKNTGMWYGLHRFFRWLETKTYKMHVRVFLSKYRGYFTCPDCEGGRLRPTAMLWRWRGKTLPDLYAMPVADLSAYLERYAKPIGDHRSDLALEGIEARLGYLEQVGLGYLSLNRSSRTLSGGETQRVNLTACLGTSLTETLFALDEPSVGLHAQDIDRLIHLLRRLAGNGNTVCVVEHDERIIRAADQVIEIGPAPGADGGQITFFGSVAKLKKDKKSLTGAYLSGRKQIEQLDPKRTPSLSKKAPHLRIRGATCHNLRNFDLEVPLGCFVALAGVSGSGKSTLLEHVVRDGLLAALGRPAAAPARLKSIRTDVDFPEVVMVDQAPLSKTPRSNPVIFVDAWKPIRDAFARTEGARQAGLSPSHFSFNSGHGRCEQCQGLGYERVEMQFLSDVYAPCISCEGLRFKEEVLAVQLDGLNVSQVLDLSVSEAIERFIRLPRTANRLRALDEVGLGYLSISQPLNTLSGGECQRLKLVKYLDRLGSSDKPSLLLLDEPTTGLHRHDVARLLHLLRRLVDNGHSLFVIEHHPDVLAGSDWLVELGPGAGREGGKIIAQGPPAAVARGTTPTAPLLAEAYGRRRRSDPATALLAAEGHALYGNAGKSGFVSISGARENNLKNLTLTIPRNAMTVVTGPSGSGKSSLAFGVVFAEGQRRFLESTSSYARQFVEQLPRPDLDDLTGIAPTVAIEQRVTRGTRKSTVGTITEVAHYLRLLYARVGTQLSPVTGEPVENASVHALTKRLKKFVANALKKRGKTRPNLLLCAPIVRGRKGHHRPLAAWAATKGYEYLRCDGELLLSAEFEGLERYAEHDVEIVVANLCDTNSRTLRARFDEALELGKGSTFLLDEKTSELTWLATSRVDPITGEAFPELEPKHFSWNSPRGWCPNCRGYGCFYEGMQQDLETKGHLFDFRDGEVCPECQGDCIGALGRAVILRTKNGTQFTLPQMLRLTPAQLSKATSNIDLDPKGKAVAELVLPEIWERLAFMETVGLGYLTLDRQTATLAGGEAQRIRLAAQLGSNLSGALYVLDEPSIGLHPQDNARLLDSLENLKTKGNTLLVVEHDEETIRRADHVIDLGPGAGQAGGHLLAAGSPNTVFKSHKSHTSKYIREGITHPTHGQWRSFPPKKPSRRSRVIPPEWFGLTGANYRNLKDLDLWLPTNRFIAFCGVSGAGKSTLARGLLKPAAAYAAKIRKSVIKGDELLNNGILPECSSQNKPLLKTINANLFSKVIEVDQSPIGKTPRSTPATYVGAWGRIRKFLASLPEARARGFDAGSFSFNLKGGRCETCKGAGRVKLEMNFLPDAYVSCEECNGLRYGNQIREMRWRGKNVSDILNLSFSEAAQFFSFDRKLKAIMNLMVDTGLGYLKLGQSSPTLSGGEAQRMKLVGELTKGIESGRAKGSRRSGKGHLYLLEEPTIGLHLVDCEKLLALFHQLVDQGHTLIVIEHNLHILADADYLVELGPGGGGNGGHMLFQGSPTELARKGETPTAPFLSAIFNIKN